MDHVGHVQKELKLALDKLDKYPQGGVYIIPVRLDDCNIEHTKIKKIHIVDLFPTEEKFKEGIRKILQVVNPDGLLLRSTPTKLTPEEVTTMIQKYGFFEVTRNDKKRFQNKYKPIKGGQVIYDEATGLMWQRSGSDELTFGEAESYIKDLNKSDFAGYADWRLPTLEEAMSLMEPVKENGLSIHPIFDSEQRWIWTSDQQKDDEWWRWVVSFDGCTCGDYGYVDDFYVCMRAVRSSHSSWK